MSKQYNDALALAKQLDRILTSDDQNVKDSLQELLTVSTLLQSDDVAGPLTSLVNETRRLNERVNMLEEKIDRENRYYGSTSGRLTDYQRNYDHNEFRRMYESMYTSNLCNEIPLPGTGTGTTQFTGLFEKKTKDK